MRRFFIRTSAETVGRVRFQKKRSVCSRIIKAERGIRAYQRQTLVVTGTTYARYTRSQYCQQRHTSSKRYLCATPRTEYGRGTFLSLSNLRTWTSFPCAWIYFTVIAQPSTTCPRWQRPGSCAVDSILLANALQKLAATFRDSLRFALMSWNRYL